MSDNKLLGNDICCVIIDELAHEDSEPHDNMSYTDCMSCQHFSGGVMDFPYCKLNKISTNFCRHYIPRGKWTPNDRVWC